MTIRFDKNPYAGGAPHNQSDASKQAAADMTPKVATVREQVFGVIAAAGERGATCNEIEDAIGRPAATVSARIRELTLLNLIKPKSGIFRKSRYGKNAHVHVLPQYAGGQND